MASTAASLASVAKATFAAGCFWGVEEAFLLSHLPLATTVGYTGGTLSSPTYGQVCAGHSGHAEAVQIEYDKEKVGYGDLLKIFWNAHDPTTPNRQGADVGSQYRSAIFYHDETQKQEAEASMKQVQERTKGHIVTEIVKASTFWPAEEYHQKYFQKQGGGQGCHRITRHGTL